MRDKRKAGQGFEIKQETENIRKIEGAELT